jgi:hypothetical protein
MQEHEEERRAPQTQGGQAQTGDVGPGLHFGDHFRDPNGSRCVRQSWRYTWFALLAWYLGPSGHVVVHAGAAVPSTFMVV